MRIAAVIAEEAGVTDPLLRALAQDLADQGLSVAGAVQRTIPGSETENRKMVVTLLPDGDERVISQDLPPGTPGCCLDPGRLEETVAAATARVRDSLDAVILSKFGQREAEGRGFRDTIARAAECDVPLILGCAPWRMADLETFLGGAPDRPAADVSSLKAWLLQT